MDEQAVFIAQFDPHLAYGLQERLRFDITDGAADFNQGHVMPFAAQANHSLDLIGDVRDDLDGRTEVFTLSLLADDVFVDLASGPVVHLAHGGADKAFVMAKIEIGFRAIIRDEDLAMLEWAHGAWIDVDIGVQLGQGHLEAASFEDSRQRRRRDALAQRGDNATGDENVFGHYGFWGTGGGLNPASKVRRLGAIFSIGPMCAAFYFRWGRSSCRRVQLNRQSV